MFLQNYYPSEYKYLEQNNVSIEESTHFIISPESLKETFSWAEIEAPLEQDKSPEQVPLRKSVTPSRQFEPSRRMDDSPPSGMSGFMDLDTEKNILPKKRMCILDIDEVRELNQQQHNAKKRRKNGWILLKYYFSQYT